MPTKKPKQPKPRTPSKKLPDPVHVPQPRPEHVPVQPNPDYDPQPEQTGTTPHQSWKDRAKDWLGRH